MGRLHQWLFSDDAGYDNRRFVSGDAHKSFSDLSLLQLSTSKSASVISSSISSVRSASDTRYIQKLLRLGDSALKVGEFRGAYGFYRRAYQSGSAIDTSTKAALEFGIGVVLLEVKELYKAEKWLGKALESQQLADFGIKTTERTQHFLCRVMTRQQKWRQAAELYEILWNDHEAAIHDEAAAASTLDTVIRRGQEYCHVLIELEQFEKAVQILKAIEPRARELWETNEHKTIVYISFDLGRAYRHLGMLAESKELLSRVRQICSESMVGNNLTAVDCNHQLAMIAYEESDYDLCEQLAAQAASARLIVDGKQNLDYVSTRKFEAMAQARLRKFQEARTNYEELLRLVTELVGRSDGRAVEIQLELAQVFLSLDEDKSAEKIYRSAFSRIYSQNPHLDAQVQATLQIAENLGQLLIRNSTSTNDRKLAYTNLTEAVTVYEYLYARQKHLLGIKSPITLQTGHFYGCLNSMVGQPTLAESTLVEVWQVRKEILGEKHPQAMQTGLQLGIVLHHLSKAEAAMTTLRSVHQLGLEFSDPQSVEVIESAELLNLCQLSNKSRSSSTLTSLSDLEASLKIRQKIYGDHPDTVFATVRLALLSMIQRKFSTSRDCFKWTFERLDNRPDLGRNDKVLMLICGVCSSITHFLVNEDATGNATLKQVVGCAEKALGELAIGVQSLKYFQAFLYLLQTKCKNGTDILRRIVSQNERQFGLSHEYTIRSYHVLGLGLIMRSVTGGHRVPAEVSDIIDKISKITGVDASSNVLIDGCFIAGMYFMQARVDVLAQPLLRFVYQHQKKRLPRFSPANLIVLAILYGSKTISGYRRTRNSVTKSGTHENPRAIVLRFWHVLISRMVEFDIQKYENVRFNNRNVLDVMAWLFSRQALWNTVKRETAISYDATAPVKFYLSGTRIFCFLDFLEQFGEPRETNSSRIWTIHSDDSQSSLTSGAPTDVKSATDIEDPDDLPDLFASEHFSTFSSSIADLLNPSGPNLKHAADRMSSLKSSLSSRLVREEDLDYARSNIDEMEKIIEADSWS